MGTIVATLRGLLLAVGILLFACSPLICAWLCATPSGNSVILSVAQRSGSGGHDCCDSSDEEWEERVPHTHNKAKSA